MEEVLYDPQTSGGLLFAVPGEVAEELRATHTGERIVARFEDEDEE